MEEINLTADDAYHELQESPNMEESSEIRTYNWDGLIDAAGGFGKFQIICLIICFLSLNGANYYSFTLSYLELEPKFLWLEGDVWKSCEKSSICHDGQLTPKSEWKIDWSNSESIHNWMTQMDLYWESNFKIGLLGSTFFFGFALWGLILKIGEIWGRKWVLIIGAITNIILSFGLYFIDNLYAKYILLFLYGVTCAKVVWTYIYIPEIVPSKAAIFWCGIINCTDIIALIPSSVYFGWIGREWKHFYIITLVISWITCPFVFFLPETPRFLYEKGRYHELRAVIKRIAKFNNSNMNHDYSIDRAVERATSIRNSGSECLNYPAKPVDIRKSTDEMVESVLKEAEFSIWGTLKRPIIYINLTICSIIFVVSTFNYYMINFYLKYAGGDLYVNVILSTISENIAYNAGSLIQSKMGTKKGFMFNLIISMSFGLPLILWDDTPWVIMVWVFCSRFGVAASFTLVYYVNQEIFPTLFVPFSFTVCNFAARLVAIAAPQIAEIPKPFPIISFLAMAGIALFSVLFLRKAKSEIEMKFEELNTQEKHMGH